jgi:hypothetical protein
VARRDKEEALVPLAVGEHVHQRRCARDLLEAQIEARGEAARIVAVGRQVVAARVDEGDPRVVLQEQPRHALRPLGPVLLDEPPVLVKRRVVDSMQPRACLYPFDT